MTATASVLRKALTTNSQATAFVAKLPTITAKATSAANGIYNLFDPDLGLCLGQSTPKFVQVIPFAVASNNHTFDMRVWGWSKTDAATPVYIPQLLVELNVTLGDVAAGNPLSSCDYTTVTAGTLLADTIAIARGDTNAQVISPGADQVASILIHTRGCRFIEFDFDLTSVATSMNAYWRVMDQS